MSKIHAFRLAAVVAAVGLCASIAAAGPTASKYKPNIGDFKIGVQSYSFRGHTFEEAVQKSRSFGLTYIEGYPGQRLSASMPDVSFGPGASPEALALGGSRPLPELFRTAGCTFGFDADTVRPLIARASGELAALRAGS